MKKNKIILRIDNLSKTYQDTIGETKAINNINLIVNEGEFVSIVGPSGCGKSTILSILSGLDKEYNGDISVYNNIKFGYMLQSDCLFSWKNVLDNCLVGLKISNKLTKENIDYVHTLLKKYGLDDFKNKYPSSLSGGMRQRVALIRTLALKPDILLLDEPLSALDSQSRVTIGEDIFNIIKQEGKTAIMVTHDISEAINISDRIIVLSKRPGAIKNEYIVEFTNESFKDRKFNNNFNILLDKIWRDLDE